MCSKEIELRKRQAEIEAELELLNLKREAAEADVECHISESTIMCSPPTTVDNIRPKVQEDTQQQTSANFSDGHNIASTSRENLNPNAAPYIPLN